MDWVAIITTILTCVSSGGWFIYYKAYKRKANGEAAQVEADGWKAQQDVYQQTIEDLKQSCTYIREDRNLLRQENQALREENNLLREKYHELEQQIIDLRKEVEKQARQLSNIFPFTCSVVGCPNRSRIEVQDGLITANKE